MVLLNHNVVTSTLGRLRSTEPAAIMPWANNEDWAKKNVDVPPDMGLKPMTLRLKVWCSTDWANRAGLNLPNRAAMCELQN